eukprot:TRINITY_DN11938_c3_g1_i1.p1 TRINITY_DN11938_c3_g1~~TRINITY_DN11938_c3_g1_i1.p1  ORF type:complete len:350 (-),score=49.86 TRINITY_DN11938_c3_g1_i1:171-1166(-)
MANPWPEGKRPEAYKVKRDRDGELISVNGVFNYQASSVLRTLVANGQIVTRRDVSGSDADLKGACWEPTEVAVHNARMEGPLSVDVQGFDLRESPTTMSYDNFYDEQKILECYYGECEALVKSVTGASSVVAFDHNLRSVSGKECKKNIEGGSKVQGPATIVHGDYTVTSGPRRLEQLSQPPKANDTLGKLRGGKPVVSEEALQTARKGAYAIVNVWRSIREEPVETLPLACCDWRTTTAEDLCVFEIHYPDRIGENYFAAHSERHKWFYFPRMTRSEAMLLKQWDSRGTLSGGSKAPFTLHSAFMDPSVSEDAPDRESIEVRCIVIFEDA